MNFNESFRIRHKEISTCSPVFIIAEIGVNHNGNFELAKEMIKVAAECKVDAVKFQSFYPEELLMEDAPKAEYQRRTTNSDESQFEMLEKLFMSADKLKLLKEYTEQLGLIFLSTPFDEKSLNDLIKLNVPAFKISSTDTTNLLFLKKVARTMKPIILSTGMCDLQEVKQALEVIEAEGNKDIILLHCTSNYPTVIEEVNMLALVELKKKFNTLIGFSDHTEGVGMAPYSVPLGVKLIEKHFTLDKFMEGPDHRASLNPEELKKLVQDIRKVELSLGEEIKKYTISEASTKRYMQKKLVFKTTIEANETIKEEHLTAKRSPEGIPANEVFKIIGKKVKNKKNSNSIVSLEDIYE